MSKDNLGYYDVYPYKQDEKYGKEVTRIMEAIEDLLAEAEQQNMLDEVLESLGLERTIDELDLEDTR